MSGFTKLVPEIVQSSIWNESSDIRIVWLTMLAVKDETGYVRGDAATLSRIANVPSEACTQALEKFQQPDPNSHTPDNEGRRIAPAPGGWMVLNSDLYRGKDEREQHREYMRQYMQKYRTGKDKPVKSVNLNKSLPSASASVSESVPEEDGIVTQPPPNPKPADIEADELPPLSKDQCAQASAVFKYACDAGELKPLDRSLERLRSHIHENLMRGVTAEEMERLCAWATDEAVATFAGVPHGVVNALDPDRVGGFLQTMRRHRAQIEQERKKRNK